MDNKLDEIRQRTEAAKAEKAKGNAIVCACLSWAIVLNDIPYLLSEVGRMNKEKQDEFDIASSYFRSWQKATARAEAAEADLRKCAPCWLCKKKCGIFDALDQRKDGCCPNFEWRGPQAGKGDSNAKIN